MAETTVEATPKVKLPPLPSVTVRRNDVDLTFVSTEILRGDDRGKLYLSPPVTEENFELIKNWCGAKTLVAKVSAFLRQLSQGWWEEAVEMATDKETGEVNQTKLLEAFTQFASTFSARGESIPALQARMDEIVTLMSELDVETMDAAEFAGKFKEYTVEIKRIQLDIEAKRRERKPKEDNNQ